MNKRIYQPYCIKAAVDKFIDDAAKEIEKSENKRIIDQVYRMHIKFELKLKKPKTLDELIEILDGFI